MSESLSADTYPTHEEEIGLSFDLIERLRTALVLYDEPLNWLSADGLVSYGAGPLYFKEPDHDEPVPYGQLGSLTPEDLRYAIYNWHFIRVTEIPETQEIRFENVVIMPGRTLIATAQGPFNAEVGSEQEAFYTNSLYDDLVRSTKQLERATLHDYANFLNGVYDLEADIFSSSDTN